MRPKLANAVLALRQEIDDMKLNQNHQYSIQVLRQLRCTLLTQIKHIDAKLSKVKPKQPSPYSIP